VNFLLDTNLVSEWMKPRPNPGVIAWMDEVDEDAVFLSSVSVLELRYGIDRLPAGKRRSELDRWLREDLVPRFGARVLPIELAVADEAGRIMAGRAAAGRPIQAIDALLAATVNLNNMTLVTRNIGDFERSVLSLLNPWT
jgi:hypothetical protein